MRATASIIVALWLGACAGGAERAAPPAELTAALGASPVTSNVLREDHAGADTCVRCHAGHARAWEASPMRRMTRLGDVDTIATPFDGRVFTFKGETVTLVTHEGRRYMVMDAARPEAPVYRVTRVIGGHHREDFAGVPVPALGAEPTTDREAILPVSYMVRTGELRFKGYSVPVTERPGIHVSGEWNATCVFCHNTAPGLLRALGDLVPRAPGYQASFVDRILPEPLRWRWEVTDDEGLRDAIARENAVLGELRSWPSATTDQVVRHAIVTTRDRLRGEHLIDIGIGCEACHRGAREHAEAPTRYHPTFEVRSDFLRFGPADGREPTEAELINRTCAQCHAVLFSRYPHTWEGGDRRFDPQGSTTNSGEARDFILGHCSRAMSCTTCHDPHGADDPAALARMRTVEGNAVCTTCHAQYEAADALAAHTHHAPDGAGSACLPCHMPDKNIGLDTNLTTYHRIGSPNDPVKVEQDRPIECALCHADASVASLVDTMERWWGTRYSRERLEALYGDLEESALMATLRRGHPHEQVVAMHRLRESEHPDRVTRVARAMVHRIPLVRYHARTVLADLTGLPVDVDLHQDRANILEDLEAWLLRHGLLVARASEEGDDGAP